MLAQRDLDRGLEDPRLSKSAIWLKRGSLSAPLPALYGRDLDDAPSIEAARIAVTVFPMVSHTRHTLGPLRKLYRRWVRAGWERCTGRKTQGSGARWR